MSSKPVVVLLLPPTIAQKMFREGDLARLRDIADVRGPAGLDESGISDALKEARAVITGWKSSKVDADVLSKAPNLGLVAHSAGTVKGLVGEEVFDRNIRVTTSASANARPVANFTLAMMNLMLKQLPWITQAFTANDQDEVLRRKALVRELQDLDVGLIGASRVGREVIKLLKGYSDLRIKVYDPYLKADEARELGVSSVSLEEACRCPVVSNHAPNIAETKHMFNARTLALLPDHAIFINTARGALVDEAALVAEVRRRPLYVALDVTDPEPPAADSPLRKEPHIILTPHIAGAMNQGCKDMGCLAIDETIRFLNGEKLQAEVTKAMLPTQA